MHHVGAGGTGAGSFAKEEKECDKAEVIKR